MRIYKIAASVALALTCANAAAGAWGTGSFDNDDALEWLGDLSATNADAIFNRAFKDVESAGSMIPLETCSIAMAAATLISRARGASVGAIPPEAQAWLTASRFSPSANLSSSAAGAVRACANSKRSELSQLWDASKESQAWRHLAQDLLNHLLSPDRVTPAGRRTPEH